MGSGRWKVDGLDGNPVYEKHARSLIPGTVSDWDAQAPKPARRVPGPFDPPVSAGKKRPGKAGAEPEQCADRETADRGSEDTRAVIDVDTSITDRVGLHAAGRGLLSGTRPTSQVEKDVWRRDRWSVAQAYYRQQHEEYDLVSSLVTRTVGEICEPQPGRVYVKTGLFLLGNDEPQEWVFPVGQDRAIVMNPGKRPIVVVSLGGVVAASLECLVREIEGFEEVVDDLLDHPSAPIFVRDVTFAVADVKVRRDRFHALKVVALVHVAEVLHLRADLYAKAREGFFEAFVMFPELMPWTQADRFVFAPNDPLRRSLLRDDASARAKGVLPHWPVKRFMPSQISTFELAVEEVEMLANLVRSRMATDGFEAAHERSIGLVDVEDDGVREVRLSDRTIRLRRHEGRFYLLMTTLLDLGGIKLEGVEIDRLVESLKGTELPCEAFYRANPVMGRGRPPAGSWWIDVTFSVDFLSFSGCATGTPALIEFINEAQGRVVPGIKRDRGAKLPQTTTNGEAVLGIWVKGELVPIALSADGRPWLSKAQIAQICGCSKQAVPRAARRLGLTDGDPGVVVRETLSLDGKTRPHLHYDESACLRLGVEMRSVALIEVIVKLSKAAVSGGGAIANHAKNVSDLKRMPAGRRMIELDS